MSNIIDALTTAMFEFQASKYCFVAALVVLTWDYFLTLAAEVNYVWRARWTISKFLFILNRYLCFIDIPLSIIVAMRTDNPGAAFCLSSVQTIAWLTKAGVLIAQIILRLRTWAIWERHIVITVYLIVEFMIHCVCSIYFFQRYLQGITYIPNPITNGCGFLIENRILYAEYTFIIFSETMLLVLLIIKALQHFKTFRGPLMTVMYNDGIVYYALILASSVGNVIMAAAGPGGLQGLLIGLQRVMHSVLCSRIILHIQILYQTSSEILASNSSSNVGGRSTSNDITKGLSVEWAVRSNMDESVASQRTATRRYDAEFTGYEMPVMSPHARNDARFARSS